MRSARLRAARPAPRERAGPASAAGGGAAAAAGFAEARLGASAGRPGGRAQTDPALRRQLAAAGARGEVEAVCALRPPARTRQPPTPAATAARVRRLLRALARETGLQPRAWHVFGHLDRFVVAAPAGFVRALLGREEVASATANRPVAGRPREPEPRGQPAPRRRRRP